MMKMMKIINDEQSNIEISIFCKFRQGEVDELGVRFGVLNLENSHKIRQKILRQLLLLYVIISLVKFRIVRNA